MALKTLDNALELLKYFSRENPSWGVRELAKEMGISHSIVYRILTTFEKHGFVVQDAETKKYELGMRFLEYGLIMQDKLRISDMMLPVMRRLAEQSGESVFLTWLDGMEAVYVEIAESSQRIKYAVSKGSRTPLYAGASNKTIMAFLPEEVQMRIIEKGLVPRTNRTIVSPNELLANLQEIRRQGWCYSIGEYADDVVGISMPLFDRRGKVTGSLTVAGPLYRMPEEKVMPLLDILKVGCQEIQDYIRTLKLDYAELTQPQ
ncbi:IclR family transcriptional regulator [Brevibacillus humidisoli]|uniref:IclR family transcriptional regulator n=1 Tax=Brevibacillus humidisoli TaxID=2895522 RepID=UPI001E411A9D|nr:IclR family transcriptional regulator [Brevibacillus humidisoli]UFJ39268.1 IclR family transcriptional regulator [Brevibacillus humidisoli]